MITYNELNTNSPLYMAIETLLATKGKNVVVEYTEDYDPQEMKKFLKPSEKDFKELLVS